MIGALVMTLAAGVGLAIQLVTLPGVWLMLLVALALQWITYPGEGEGAAMYSWWTLGVAGALALLGEALEFLTSAVTVRRAGGLKLAAVGAALGAVVGAVLGIPWLPPLGPVIGATLGAAAGAMAGQAIGLRRRGERVPAGRLAALGAAAAGGQLAALLVKLALAVVVAVTLVVGAWWP